MTLHDEAAATHAVPARGLERGFRILVLRQFLMEAAPPEFAVIAQQLFRAPGRTSRHGLFFAATFRSEIMAWLSGQLGPPSLREQGGPPFRNPRWPVLTWHGEDRLWPDGTRTTEWHVDIAFQDEPSRAAFQQHWSGPLQGEALQDQVGV
jgi:hypothetical protein